MQKPDLIVTIGSIIGAFFLACILIVWGWTMKPNITLSSGRVIGHKPYLSNGLPNGATEAYVIGGGNMTDDEWHEYCHRMMPNAKPKAKPTWEQIKAR